MSDKFIKSGNSILFIFSAICVIVALLGNLAVKGSFTNTLVLCFAGIPFCMGIKLAMIRNRNPKFIRNLFIISLYIIMITMTHFSPKLNKLYFLFLILTLLAIYQNYKLIIYSWIFNIIFIVSTTFLYGDTMYRNENILKTTGIIIVYMTLCAITLICQCQLSMKANNALENKSFEIERAKSISDKIANKIMISVDDLTTIKNKNFNNLNIISTSAKFIEEKLGNIVNNADYQEQTLTSVLNKINEQECSINHIKESSTNISLKISETNHMVEDGYIAIKDLNSKIEDIDDYNGIVNNTIKDLQNEVNNITNILTTIKDISNQTNLLALNASIESSKAGEHGKSFFVIANEITQLSQNSKNATSKIESLMDNILLKIRKVSEAIDLSNNSINVSLKKSENTYSIFNNINNTTHDLVNSSKDIDTIINNYLNSSKAISEEFKSLNEISLDGVKSIDDIFEYIKEQNNQIYLLNNSFSELSKLIEELDSISTE